MEPRGHDRVLDVREIDGKPFEPIMQELNWLEDDETMLLVNGFEPLPLYDELRRRGFDYSVEGPEDLDVDEWRVEIARG